MVPLAHRASRIALASVLFLLISIAAECEPDECQDDTSLLQSQLVKDEAKRNVAASSAGKGPHLTPRKSSPSVGTAGEVHVEAKWGKGSSMVSQAATGTTDLLTWTGAFFAAQSRSWSEAGRLVKQAIGIEKFDGSRIRVGASGTAHEDDEDSLEEEEDDEDEAHEIDETKHGASLDDANSTEKRSNASKTGKTGASSMKVKVHRRRRRYVAAVVHHGSPVGIIIGAVVAGFCFCCVIIPVCWCCLIKGLETPASPRNTNDGGGDREQWRQTTSGS